MITKSSEKWPIKLEEERFRRRRHNQCKKLFELCRDFDDVDAYLVVRRKRKHYVYTSEDRNSDKAWPPTQEDLREKWPAPTWYYGSHPRRPATDRRTDSTRSSLARKSLVRGSLGTSIGKPARGEADRAFWQRLLTVPKIPDRGSQNR